MCFEITHKTGSVTMVIVADEIAKAAKLNVVLKSLCVVCVKSAANPSTMIANIMAKTETSRSVIKSS